MPIEKTPNGTYRARWREPGRTNPRSKSFKRLEDAERFLRGVLTDIDRGTYVGLPASSKTVATTAEDWLAAARRLRPSTRETYRRDLDRHVLPKLGALRLDRLTPEAIDSYLDGRLAAGAAPTSVARERRTISAMCTWAVRRGRLPLNPVDRTDPPAIPHREHRYLTAGEVEALATAIQPHRKEAGVPTLVGPGRFRALVLVGAWGGLRWSEMVGLRPDDVDGATLHVRSQLLQSRTTKEWYRATTKTAAGARRVVLPASVADELAEHMEAFAVDDGPQGPLVFPTQRGGPVTYSSWRTNHWGPALARAGVGRVRPHDLRHTAVALAVAAGAHPKTVQVRMGHSSIKVTLDTYGHLFPDLEDTLAVDLDALRRPGLVAA